MEGSQGARPSILVFDTVTPCEVGAIFHSEEVSGLVSLLDADSILAQHINELQLRTQ